MNPQLSFSSEDVKENFSTPKFHKNKSTNSIEKEENTLDTLKQQIDKVYNDKDTLNNDNINESKNEKNILLNSLLNNNSNLDLNNFYMSQFSFDEKSSNFLSKKENSEKTQNENDNNKNIILINEDNIEKNKVNVDENNKNEENNNEIKYINKINNEENDKNEDSNFDYELPLGSDDNPEFFCVPQDTEEIKEKDKIEKKNAEGDNTHIDAPPPESKNNEILTPKKQQKNKRSKKIQSAKINFDENKLFKMKENEKKENNLKFNSSNKKINKILKYSSLKEENSKSNEYLTEQNNNIIESNTYNNSFKNTNFTSKDNNLKKEPSKINNDKLTINPFMIEKIEKSENTQVNRDISRKFKINSDIIKDITITYYERKNKKNRNSINIIGRNNNFLDFDNFNKTNIIYEKKNLSIEEPRSFSITKNGSLHHSHSRNYKELKNNNTKNETMTSSNYYMNKRIKNRVILLTKDKNRKNKDFFGRNNSLKNLFLSEYQNFSQKSLEKKNIEGKTERSSPFRKSKINDSFMTKNSSYKNYILNNNQILKRNQQAIIKKHNKNMISQSTFNEDYSKEEEKYPNTKHTLYMNFQNRNNTFKNKGNLTQRNKDIEPINIYSKKILFIPNGNNNQNKLKQKLIKNIPNKNKVLKKKEINKSYIIPKEKNNKILNNEGTNIIKNKTRTNFKEYFKDILSKINITKTIVNQRPNLNNKNQKEQNDKHKIRKIIQLSNIDMNTMTTKTIQTSNKINYELKNKLINSKINKEKNKTKNTFEQSRKNIIEMFRNNILNYTINRNNKNNQVKKEVSIFIGENTKINNNNNKNVNLKKNFFCKNKNLDKDKKTIINVNQYYSSYYIKK